MNYSTYCPEDNKLRLYVGRVPRDEYEKLRDAGWTNTPKQSCDFVATWTPSRYATALEYGEGTVEDEDQTPEDRAADRAERFAGYREKRLGEATGFADKYEAGPSAHGFQSEARAQRAETRHDRVGGYAADAWSKAEYWQSRTAGVISHALYSSLPGVRMGRIKELEAELRKLEKSLAEYAENYRKCVQVSQMQDAEKQTAAAIQFFGGYGYSAYDYKHPRPEQVLNSHIRETGSSIYGLLTLSESEYGHDITGAEACQMWLARHSEPATDTQWTRHLKLRLAYENQMLEAQGGRAAHVEMQVGGFIGGRQIHRVCKSPVTGRVVSVFVKGPKVQGWVYQARNVPGTDYALYQIETERLPADAYRAPTTEELAAFQQEKKSAKATAPKKPECPLVNPTDADAERLQVIWNEKARADQEARNKRNGYTLSDFTPSTVLRVTQATYSAHSKGTYCSASTRSVFAGGHECELNYNAAHKMRDKYGLPVCQVRRTSGGNYQASRVIVITDKPQKPFPAAVWEVATVETATV